jgi:Leucine rich repeat
MKKLQLSAYSLLVVLGMVFSGNSYAQKVNTADSLELVRLYNATKGGDWTNNSNWLTSAPAATWFGVSVDTAGRVSSLVLPNNNLVDSLPKTFVNMRLLRTLDLSNNQLTGSLPSMVNLTVLNTLNLSNNKLSGTILGYPRGSIVTINLSNNRFTGAAPALNTASHTKALFFGLLKEINLSHNSFSGNLPAAGLGYILDTATKAYPGIQADTSLIRVDLSYNNFTGGAGNTMAPSVQYYDISHNQIAGAAPAPTVNVTYCDYSYNLLTGNFLAGYPSRPKLETLILRNNRMTGGMPYFNGTHFVGLKTLVLDSNKFVFSNFEAVAFSLPGQPGSKMPAAKGGSTSVGIQDTLLKINFNTDSAYLTVAPTGTTRNNTFKWYLENGTLLATKTGDSTYRPTEPGTYKYFAQITNSAIPTMVLKSALSIDILPVTLAAFSAQNNGSQVLLSWNTATEINNAYFEVERSFNGLTFTKVGTVAAQASFKYQFTDYLTAAFGKVYYRLKQVDNNGAYAYTNVLVVSANSDNNKVAVAPNPFINKLSVAVKLAQAQTVTIRISDANGKVWVSKKQSVQAGDNLVLINEAATFAKGTYVVEVCNLAGTRIGAVKAIK